jgi:prolipoprotein diacylglyceryltransferase
VRFVRRGGVSFGGGLLGGVCLPHCFSGGLKNKNNIPCFSEAQKKIKIYKREMVSPGIFSFPRKALSAFFASYLSNRKEKICECLLWN